MAFDLSSAKHIHFIGIGGSSMSGLAEMLLRSGYRVSGSDERESERTERLSRLGARIYMGHSEKNIMDNPDLVVYTVAVNSSNPELNAAREKGLPVIVRAELLGQMMKSYNHRICISGTHGKTTTTSMVSLIMLHSGLDPTIHIGAEFQPIGGSVRVGGKNFFITEADEYHESFLKFNPCTAVVLNIEADHLDYFKDINHIMDAYRKFISEVPKNGYLIACIDDPNTRELVKDANCNVITYGIKSDSADWLARDIKYNESGFPEFAVIYKNQELGQIRLAVPGCHNVYNALGAAAACHANGCSFESIKLSLSEYRGSHHRFETKGKVNGITVIDDYAHHPSEIRASLEAASKLNYNRVWCVFQPHTYTRTKYLFEDFANSFGHCYYAVITDIYAARETDNGEIHSKMLVDRIVSKGQNAVYISDFEQIVDYLVLNAAPGDLVLTMGAGDISKVGDMFLESYPKESPYQRL
ncbi:MAG TPA: UDP-N-acetylmuramate--L-alanine ligase [Clostridiaceae bacterium]|nr:UDP-N-acetylmuramate--L-alanine ligase [Clostridiaceae bacterium]